MRAPYVLSVPLGKNHWATLVVNKPMELEHFDTLDKFLRLQREILADDEVDNATGEENTPND